MLPEETEKLGKAVKSLQNDLTIAKGKFKVAKASLEAVKQSMEREVKLWKDRVNSLVSKFHKVRLYVGVFF